MRRKRKRCPSCKSGSECSSIGDCDLIAPDSSPKGWENEEEHAQRRSTVLRRNSDSTVFETLVETKRATNVMSPIFSTSSLGSMQSFGSEALVR